MLLLFSKIYMKVVYNRLYDYIVFHNMLYDNRFGFRDKDYFYMALITLINLLSDVLYKFNAVIGLFLDFFKGLWHCKS